MISYATFKILERKRVNGVLFAEFLLYSLALALQGFSGILLKFSLFAVVGWIWSSRQRLPNGTRALPGPWGKMP